MNWLATRPLYSALSSSSSMSHGSTSSDIPRRIFVNNEFRSQKFCSNEISTCKYNAFSFLPRFLLEQFRRYSNVFFLIIALLQQIPDISPTGRYTTAVPFLIILSVSAIKEIFEDLKRRKMDNKVNNFKVLVLKRQHWERTRWKDIKVGEIVKIEEDQTFPADLMLISSSEPDGFAYIETSNLDGETNLKNRQATFVTSGFLTVDALNQANLEIECEPPNRHVNEFTGTLKFNNDRVPLSISQLLLRGAKLKNTKWIFGAVVYAGHDARLLMNSRIAPLKRSNIDSVTNNRILFLFSTLVILTIVSAIGAEFYNSFIINDTVWYISTSQPVNFARNALTFFILYNNLIPISLQVTLEIVRFFQAAYINSDLLMYDESTDTPANARTSNLNEELGQVKFLMTDKTGTLTCNIMKFKRCSIGGVSYGNDSSEEFYDEDLIRALENDSQVTKDIREFLLMMATCHTAVPEQKNGVLRYQSSSPDEGALVRGASNQGFIFHTRKAHSIVVKTNRDNVSLQLLNVLEFTSDRKRMSVIVKDENDVIKLYCKGADNVIFERLSSTLNDPQSIATFTQHLEEYACKGYRTLCFGVAIIDPGFYATWNQNFSAASIAIEDREKKLAEVAEQIECNLRLIGVSAIEDKLQDHVPCTIRALLEAGIRIWILTGDKRETAVNIAQSSALCTKDTKLLVLDKRSYDDVLSDLNKFKEIIEQYMKEGTEFAIVISGSALHHAISGEARRIFTEMALVCHSVVCCRMTPMQKAEVVEIMRQITGEIVLAVGDGANDVAMIQAANVGVGITGEEGLQAASASDYSIKQFHYLRRLLLVHGLWNYDRSVKVILYSFYKNICLYIIELWFAFFSAFSGQTIFERWTIATFNVAFTALPPIMLGLFDKPISSRLALNNPSLYQEFQKSAFSNFKFGLWIFLSLWHSLLLFFLTYGMMGHQIAWGSGNIGGWLLFGNMAYTYVVVTVCLKALLECDSWTYVIWFSCIGSIVLWILFLFLYSWVWPFLPLGSNMSGMAWIMFTSKLFWLGLIFVPITTLLTDFMIKGLLTNLSPTPSEMIRLNRTRKLSSPRESGLPENQTHVRAPSSGLNYSISATSVPSYERNEVGLQSEGESVRFISRATALNTATSGLKQRWNSSSSGFCVLTSTAEPQLFSSPSRDEVTYTNDENGNNLTRVVIPTPRTSRASYGSIGNQKSLL